MKDFCTWKSFKIIGFSLGEEIIVFPKNATRRPSSELNPRPTDHESPLIWRSVPLEHDDQHNKENKLYAQKQIYDDRILLQWTFSIS